jgi:hypothetical protein
LKSEFISFIAENYEDVARCLTASKWKWRPFYEPIFSYGLVCYKKAFVFRRFHPEFEISYNLLRNTYCLYFRGQNIIVGKWECILNEAYKILFRSSYY